MHFMRASKDRDDICNGSADLPLAKLSARSQLWFIMRSIYISSASYSPSHKVHYHQITESLEISRLCFGIIEWVSNFRAIRSPHGHISRLRDFAGFCSKTFYCIMIRKTYRFINHTRHNAINITLCVVLYGWRVSLNVIVVWQVGCRRGFGVTALIRMLSPTNQHRDWCGKVWCQSVILDYIRDTETL